MDNDKKFSVERLVLKPSVFKKDSQRRIDSPSNDLEYSYHFYPLRLSGEQSIEPSLLSLSMGKSGRASVLIKLYYAGEQEGDGIAVYPARILSKSDDSLASQRVDVDFASPTANYTLSELMSVLKVLESEGFVLESDAGDSFDLTDTSLVSVRFSEGSGDATVVLTL